MKYSKNISNIGADIIGFISYQISQNLRYRLVLINIYNLDKYVTNLQTKPWLADINKGNLR